MLFAAPRIPAYEASSTACWERERPEIPRFPTHPRLWFPFMRARSIWFTSLRKPPRTVRILWRASSRLLGLHGHRVESCGEGLTELVDLVSGSLCIVLSIVAPPSL